jgi:hypothetical protein
MDPVTYTGSAIFDLGNVKDSLIDDSKAVVKIIDGSGYYADEFILNADTLDGEWINGKYTYTLSEGDIEWNTWDYDTSPDYNSGREWSIMGGDGSGVYHLTLEVSGIQYNYKELKPVTFPVNIYIYGRTCDDIALSTQFTENTVDSSYTSELLRTTPFSGHGLPTTVKPLKTASPTWMMRIQITSLSFGPPEPMQAASPLTM